jgi:hypothetical protein
MTFKVFLNTFNRLLSTKQLLGISYADTWLPQLENG